MAEDLPDALPFAPSSPDWSGARADWLDGRARAGVALLLALSDAQEHATTDGHEQDYREVEPPHPLRGSPRGPGQRSQRPRRPRGGLARAVGFATRGGWNLFGTAAWTFDYGFVGANTFWYMQVAFVVVGHVAALVLAHDRALASFHDAKAAVLSQLWLLGVMVGFTTPALWLQAQGTGTTARARGRCA